MEKVAENGFVFSRQTKKIVENIIMRAVNQELLNKKIIDEDIYCMVNQKIEERG